MHRLYKQKYRISFQATNNTQINQSSVPSCDLRVTCSQCHVTGYLLPLNMWSQGHVMPAHFMKETRSLTGTLRVWAFSLRLRSSVTNTTSLCIVIVLSERIDLIRDKTHRQTRRHTGRPDDVQTDPKTHRQTRRRAASLEEDGCTGRCNFKSPVSRRARVLVVHLNT